MWSVVRASLPLPLRAGVSRSCVPAWSASASASAAAAAAAAAAAGSSVRLLSVLSRAPSSPSSSSSEALFRSVLFLKPPFTVERMRESNADVVVLDFEDGAGQLPEMKAKRRAVFLEALRAGHLEASGIPRICVRVNELDSMNELTKDVDVAMHRAVQHWMLPKLHTARDVEIYEALATRGEALAGLPAGHITFLPIIETVVGLENAYEISKATPRNRGVIFGHADFLLETEGVRTLHSLIYPRSRVMSAGRAAGILPIDTPYLNLTDNEGLWDDCRHARTLGFAGKILLHPRQSSAANITFSPSAEQLEYSRKVVEVTDNGAKIGMLGSFMVGPPHNKRAKQVLAAYEANAKAPVESVRARRASYGFAPASAAAAEPGHVFASPFRMTVSDAMLQAWNSTCLTYRGPSVEADVARDLFDAPGRMLPVGLLSSLTLSMCVEEFSENSVVHLGIRDAVSHAPVCPGDTVTASFVVDGASLIEDGKNVVLHTTHSLVNQRGETAFTLRKRSLFAGTPELVQFAKRQMEGNAAKQQQQQQPYALPEWDASPSDAAGALGDPLLARMLARAARSPDAVARYAGMARGSLRSSPLAVDNEVALHVATRYIGASENAAWTTALCNTHPIHLQSDRLRFGGPVVIGPIVQATCESFAERDLHPVLWQAVRHSGNINRVSPNDTLSAMSVVLKRRPLADGKLELLRVKTIGAKNIDLWQAVASEPLPRALFAEKPMKRSEYESLCENHLPMLSGKVAIESVRDIVRLA